MKFDDQNYSVKKCKINEETITYRSFLHIPYVEKPIEPAFQMMNIFVPESFYKNDEINGYRIKTAPIFMPNTVGGYMPAQAIEPGADFFNPQKANTLFLALQHGYVVVCPAIRGRSQDYGKAPACIVDYKAAVRFLRRFTKFIPGDAEKIVTNGTSAGGALSALMGGTGNANDYEPYLSAIGAANERDDIFAASCYCPISNLENADAAYEWQFFGVNNFHRMKMNLVEGGRPTFTPEDGVMSPEQISISNELKLLFPEYVNKLGLKDSNGLELSLDKDGNGSFKKYIESMILASAQTALDEGENLGEIPWLSVEQDKAVSMNFGAYTRNVTRMKTAPAFDGLSLESPENNLFGTPVLSGRHFTPFSYKHTKINGVVADPCTIRMLNPLTYIGKPGVSVAKYWRIRHGGIDRDTSLAISAILTLILKKHDCCVDYFLPWNTPHSGDYDCNELFTWIDNVCGVKA